MTGKQLLAAAVCGSVWVGVCLGDGGTAADPWKSFEFTTEKVASLTVRWEKPLAPKMPAIRQALRAFLKEQHEAAADVQTVSAKTETICRRVNEIVGFTPTQEQRAEQRKVLSTFLGHSRLFWLVGEASGGDLRIVTGESTKQHLRDGGTLPGFTYDKATDTAGYDFSFAKSRTSPNIEKRPMVIPVPVERADKQLAAFLQMLRRQGTTGLGLAFHELAEVTMMSMRLKSSGLYFRWFSDGFANVIAIEVLKEAVGKKAASAFAKSWDVGKYADLERQIHLRYWLGLGLHIRTPLASEKRLDHARYCFATFEATRLVRRHGLACIPKILARADRPEAKTDPERLLHAAADVTGEDLAKRLARYQTFATRAEGTKLYAKKLNGHGSRKDYAAALSAFLRLREMKEPTAGITFMVAANLLFRIGHEAAGDRAILDCANRMKGRDDNGYVSMHMMFIDYAMGCGNLSKAIPSADIVLLDKPDWVPALGVRLAQWTAQGRTDEARGLAQRIVKLDADPKSPWRQMAQRVLRSGP